MNTGTMVQTDINETYLIHPKKLVMWLLIVASIMMFAGFTSAYIVRRGEGNWEIFDLPSLFFVNTILIAISSLTLQLAYRAAKRDQLKSLTMLIGTTLLLGIGFCAGQWFAWKELVANNVFFAFSNPSNSFVYVITGLHVFHVLAGLVFMAIMWVNALQHKIHKKALLYMNMCTTYWHFIGILWVYLFMFLYLNR